MHGKRDILKPQVVIVLNMWRHPGNAAEWRWMTFRCDESLPIFLHEKAFCFRVTSTALPTHPSSPLWSSRRWLTTSRMGSALRVIQPWFSQSEAFRTDLSETLLHYKVRFAWPAISAKTRECDKRIVSVSVCVCGGGYTSPAHLSKASCLVHTQLCLPPPTPTPPESISMGGCKLCETAKRVAHSETLTVKLI